MAHRNRGASASSRAAKNSAANADDEPHPLYGPDGQIWEDRPLPKIIMDLMQPVQKPVPIQPGLTETLLGFMPPKVAAGNK